MTEFQIKNEDLTGLKDKVVIVTGTVLTSRGVPSIHSNSL